MTTFLRATLDDGTQVISEFTKLTRVGRYAAEVMSGDKALNVWRVVSRAHPTSGEPVLIRTRMMISGRIISHLEQVRPDQGYEQTHEYEPGRFSPVQEMERGRYGLWTCPTPVPEGAPGGLVAGMEYPIHRDVRGFGDRYVIVRVAGPNGDPDEVRYLYEQRGVPSAVRPDPRDQDVDDLDTEDVEDDDL